MKGTVTLRKRGDYRTLKEYIAHFGVSLEKIRDWRKKSYRIDRLLEAASLIRDAARIGIPVRIIADYDVDGITSGAGLVRIAKKAGAKDVKLCVPCRYDDGYGANPEQVKSCPDGCLLILVDNGISAFTAILEAKKRGMTVLVLDHHQAGVGEDGHPVYPEADVLIDPAALPGSADWDKYCASGLVFKLAELMFPEDEEWLDRMCVNAMLATIADVVELKEDNYRIVERGIACANTGRAFPGVLALLKEMSTETLTTEAANYRINPVLNAPGRMLRKGARMTADLFLSDDPSKCAVLVSQMRVVNDRRKAMCDERMKVAKEVLKGRDIQTVNVVYLPDTLTGVVGLIAGRLAEEYGRTFIVVTEGNEPGVLQGSARSAGNTDIKKLLDRVRRLLVRYGGHPKAAGAALLEKDLEELDSSLNEEADLAGYHGDERKGEIPYDFSIKTNRVRGLLKSLSIFHFGEGFPAPVFRIMDYRPSPVNREIFRIVGADSVKMVGQDGVQSFGHHMAGQIASFGQVQELTLVGTLSWNEFKGTSSPQVSLSYAAPNEMERPDLPLIRSLAKIANKK